MQHFAGTKGKAQALTAAHVETLSVDDKLKYAIINGEKTVGAGANKKTLEGLLEDALGQYSPGELINTVLLDGMRTFGELVRRPQDAVAVGSGKRAFATGPFGQMSDKATQYKGPPLLE